MNVTNGERLVENIRKYDENEDEKKLIKLLLNLKNSLIHSSTWNNSLQLYACNFILFQRIFQYFLPFSISTKQI